MNASKQQYITTIRADTSYPTYRRIVGIVAKIGYAFSGILALFAVFALIHGVNLAAADVSSFGYFLPPLLTGCISIVASALIFLGGRFCKEAALILVDIADSITDANSRAQ
jgi:hypothetical protein